MNYAVGDARAITAARPELGFPEVLALTPLSEGTPMLKVGVLTAGIGVALAVGPVDLASAAQAAALVLEANGTMAPQLAPYREILPDAAIVLHGHAKLVFVHYFTCQKVIAVGGTVRVEAGRYAIAGGTVSESRTPCPRRVSLKSGAETGGIMVRGIRPPHPGASLLLSRQPSFVVVGVRAEDVAAVRIVREGQTVLEASLDGHRFQWPADSPVLLADTDYQLIVLFRTAAYAPVTLTFTTSATSEMPAPGLVLLDVD